MEKYELSPRALVVSGVASIDNWRGEYSYIFIHKMLKTIDFKKVVTQNIIYEYSPLQISTLAALLFMAYSGPAKVWQVNVARIDCCP